ncbi:MAG: chemotaxis protein CheX [Polyangiaceae bacterium]
MMSAHLSQAIASLFAGYELAVWPCENAVGTAFEREVVASIGFTGKQFRGALMLRAADTSIDRWLESMGMPGGDLSDTLSEFSNMLLGRIKGQMLRDGMPIALATPTATSGTGLRFSMPPAESVCLSFDGGDWGITARLDASFESDFEIGPPAAEEAAEAGDCLLF